MPERFKASRLVFHMKQGILSSMKRAHNSLYSDAEWIDIYHSMYITRNMTQKEMATELGCGNGTVAAAFLRIGLQSRPSYRRSPKHLSTIKWEEVYEKLYVEQQMTHREIAKQLGCSRGHIKVMFDKRNLLSRKPHARQTRCRQDAFANWSKEMAYWAGFIAADGSLHKNC